MHKGAALLQGPAGAGTEGCGLAQAEQGENEAPVAPCIRSPYGGGRGTVTLLSRPGLRAQHSPFCSSTPRS